MRPGLVPVPGARVRHVAVALVMALLPLVAHAVEKLPIQSDATRARYNLRSTSGVPTSSSAGNPAGSDGRAPAPGVENASGSFNDATGGQFQIGRAHV